MASSKTLTAALIGNPNCGKSTLFNALTGARQSVGNFPGVTLECFEGVAVRGKEKIRFIDLPGVYSLTACADEERFAADYLNEHDTDMIVNIVDAACLERHLYLTLLLLEQNRPVVVVLNMMDVARRRGIKVDGAALSRLLGVPVVETISNRSIGIDAVLTKIIETAATSADKRTRNLSSLNSSDAERYEIIANLVAQTVRRTKEPKELLSDRIDTVLTHRWFGVLFFFLMMYLVFQMTFTLGQYPMDWMESGFAALGDFLKLRWPETLCPFLKSLVIDGVIGGVGGVLIFLPNVLLLFLAISILEDSGYMARAALLADRWMHKIGLNGRSIAPLLIGFGCTVPALMATKMLTNRRERLATMFILPLFSCGARFPIYALLIPAFFAPLWRGPVLWLVYLIGVALAAGVAKLFARLFPHDESSFFMIELAPYHFPTFRSVGVRTLQRGGLYVKKAGTVILGFSVLLWFLTTFPELSPEKKEEFHAKRDKVVAMDSNERTCAAALERIDREEESAHLIQSYAGRLGHGLEPIFRPLGFDWKITTAFLGAIAAKEVFVAQMGIVCSADGLAETDETNFSGNVVDNLDDNGHDNTIDNMCDKSSDILSGKNSESDDSRLTKILARQYSPLTGFSVLLFCLIASPCMATFVMMAKESGSWRWAFAQWGFLTALAWLLSAAVYQIGSCFF